MNYKNIYIEKTPEELELILDKIEELSYEAKTALYDYLMEQPKGIVVEDVKMEELKASYQSEDDDINNLTHLSNLGLKIKGSLNEFTIKRSRSAIIVDVTGVIVGVFLMMKLKSAYEGWETIVMDGVGIMSTVWASINTIIGVFGFILFTKVLNRIIEFSSFKIIKQGEDIIITKTQDLRKKTYQILNTNIRVEKEENATILAFIHNNVKHNLIGSNEGRVLQNTIQALGHKLKE